MRIPDETVDRVRTAVDIVSLIGEHVRLTKAGRSFKGLCPFHTEKTPSFMVSPEKQAYHCFGCGAGGTAITFLREYAKMSFPEAVRYLAERAGIEIPRVVEDPAREMETTRLLEALAHAAAFFRERYLHPYAGKPARDYLARRGLDPELVELFGLGFAPDGWHSLADAARKKFTPEILVKAGLIIPREDGSHYDRFRNRLMVPVLNPMGKVVGFGGRAIGDEEPKYINSPESPVYQKGQILFGLGPARDAMHRADEAILVEGYLDLLRVHGAGFQNVAAVAGTAFTPHQAMLLKRYVERVVLVFDGDAAGVNAAWRAAGPCAAAGLDVRLALLPPEHDPDSLIRDEGAAAFGRVLESARTLVEFAATRIAGGAGREEALHRLVEVIREMPDPIRRRLTVQEAAERLRFDEATLARSVEAGREPRAPSPGGAARPERPAEPDPAERELVTLLLHDPSLAAGLEGISEEELEHPLCREIFRQIVGAAPGRFSAGRLMETEPESPLARFVSLLLAAPGGGGAKAVRVCAGRLKRRRLDARLAGLTAELHAAEKTGDAERALAIRREMTDMTKLRKSTLVTGAGPNHD